MPSELRDAATAIRYLHSVIRKKCQVSKLKLEPSPSSYEP